MDSGGLDEPFLATGTGDGNFSLAPGNTDGLPTLGAVKIPVLAIPDLVKEPKEFPVFLITGIGIPGEHPKQCPEHQAIGQQGQYQMGQRSPQKGRNQADNHRCTQKGQTQLISAISASHKTPEASGEPVEKLLEHGITLYDWIIFNHYSGKQANCNKNTPMFTECLIIP